MLQEIVALGSLDQEKRPFSVKTDTIADLVYVTESQAKLIVLCIRL